MFQAYADNNQQETGKFTDTSGHWAAQSIEKWTEKGLMSGYPDGSFKPGNSITRAEFCSMVNSVFSFSKKSLESYTDILQGKWYTDVAAIAKAEGYTKGWAETAFEGDVPIKREEAVLALFNAFRFSAVDTGEYLSKFTDLKTYNGIAKEAIAALTASTVISGYPDKTFRPESSITRAESIKIFDNIIGELFKTSGSFSGITVKGNAVINKTDVILKDVVITGNLYLTEGIGEGNITLNNVKVSGKTFICGGSANSIHIDNSKLADVFVDKDNGKIRILASGSTVNEVIFMSGGSYETINPLGTQLPPPNVVIDSNTPAGQIIEISGNIGTLVCNAPGVIIKIAKGALVNSFTINKGANGVELTVEGKITKASINADKVKVNDAYVLTGATMQIDSTTNRLSGSGGSPSQPQVEKVVAPTFSPVAASFTSEQAITISCATASATIRYTTDGTTPNAASATYTTPITVSATTTIKAYAVKTGLADSDVSSATYTINLPPLEKVVAPNFSPATGTYASEQTVIVSCATASATIRYTTDGTTPNAASAIYSTPITVSATTTIKAYAVKTGLTDSDVATAIYTINLPPLEKVVAPTFSPATGTYASEQTVIVSCATASATIRYTTDGTTPNAASATYTTPITVSATTTIKAYAVKTGLTDSDVSTSQYTISAAPVNLALNRPALSSSSLGGGTSDKAFDGIANTRWESIHAVDPQWLSVDIGASIISGVKLTWEAAAGKNYKIQVSNDNLEWTDVYEKTNGTNAAVEEVTFKTPINAEFVRMYGISRTMQYGYSLFEFEVFGYNDASKVTKPVITPDTGTYTSQVTVSIANVTPEATIIYTTNGSVPTTGAGIVYDGPFTVSTTSTVKAIAYKLGLNNSNITACVFTIEHLGTPTGFVKASTSKKSVTLAWTASKGATGYNVYRASNIDGPYNKLEASPIDNTRFTDIGLTADTAYYYKISAVNTFEESVMSAAVTATTVLSTAPDFGPNVLIFDSSMDINYISDTCTTIFSQMETNQFGNERYALLFKPGTYNLTKTLRIGFYTQVAGLGKSPDDVAFGGSSRLGVDAGWFAGNATQNFWRSLENLSVNGDTKWAVSQASPFRRVHIKGNLRLADGGYSSGGFISDSLIDGNISSESQQQWLSRNSKWGSWNGGVWNMVFVGDNNTPTGSWPDSPYTVVDQTPVIREKPFLTVDAEGNYSVFVPALQSNTKGITWGSNTPAGTYIPISEFYITHPETDTAESINTALGEGKHLLFTPGIYSLEDTIRITKPNTIVLGLGFATLTPINGNKAMTIADVDGVIVSGLLFDAGATESTELVEVGPADSSSDHSTNPVYLSDLFFRVGGSGAGKAEVCLTINSDDVIGDYFWIWRADHGDGVGWDINTARNGLIVNGDDVTIYALMTEHFQEYQSIWNGNGGRMYFYQSEWAYEIPNQASWMNGSENGYASYKIADTVTSHEAWGLGMYTYFRDADIKVSSAIETPVNQNVKIHNACSVFLNGFGEVTHVVNDIGGTAKAGTIRQTINNFPADYMPKTATPVITPSSGVYTEAKTVTINDGTAGATIRYTTDGSTPTATNGTVYTEPFTLSATKTVKAIAYKVGIADSDIVTALFTINILPTNMVAAPTFTPAPGTYSSAQTVTLSSTTNGATIKYTTNGNTPDSSSSTYTGPITVSSTITIKAYAFKAEMTDSTLVEGLYTISSVVEPTVTLYLYNTDISGVTPAGQNLQGAKGTTTGWNPTKTITTTPAFWYSPELTGNYDAGNWSLTLWSNSPTSASTVEVSLYKVNADGSEEVQIGSSQTCNVNATGAGNHTSTFNFTGLPVVNFSNQRLLVKIVKIDGVDCTIAYNSNDFPSILKTPTFNIIGGSQQNGLEQVLEVVPPLEEAVQVMEDVPQVEEAK